MSAAAVTEIYLVRHGETDWNRVQRLQGRIDTPLNRIGLAQAHQVADRFCSLTATVVTSPLARARHTARAIALRSQSALLIDPLLAEIDHGSWAGLTLPAVAHAFPGAVIDDHLHPDAFDVSRGEALIAAYRRASTALLHFVSVSRVAPVVIVSHGVINALMTCVAAGRPPALMDHYTQGNGSTFRLQFRRRTLIAVDWVPSVASRSKAAISNSLQRHVDS